MFIDSSNEALLYVTPIKRYPANSNEKNTIELCFNSSVNEINCHDNNHDRSKSPVIIIAIEVEKGIESINKAESTPPVWVTSV
jgi:hypothetical protein